MGKDNPMRLLNGRWWPVTPPECALQSLFEGFAPAVTAEGRRYGGMTALAEALTGAGHPITAQSVQRWQVVPPQWIAPVVWVARAHGFDVFGEDLRPDLFPANVLRRMAA